LAAPGDLRADPERLELAAQALAGLVDVRLALLALLVDQALDLRVLARVQRLEREVLELPLQRVDAEAVRDRGEDLEGLLRLVDLLVLRHRADRPHVVQAVGELDEDDPDVRGHRHDHLAVVLGLRLVARLERDAGELRDAVDEAGDLLAELGADLVERRRRVLDGVVQQRGDERLGVEAHAAQIFATPTGWTMKSSPDLRRWSAWCSQAKTNAARRGRGRSRPRSPRRAPRRSRTGRRAAALERGEVVALDDDLALGVRDPVDRRAPGAQAARGGACVVRGESHRRPCSSRC
jgi:hypothetical protein